MKTPPVGRFSRWDWVTPATVTSTATQTLDDGRLLHQWRSIQGQYLVELQKVQHNVQYALNKQRDSGRSSGSHSPTAMLEQMRKRLRNIAQDMYILNRSCGEEIVRSSLACARQAARPPEVLRPTRRPVQQRSGLRPTRRPVQQRSGLALTEEWRPGR